MRNARKTFYAMCTILITLGLCGVSSAFAAGTPETRGAESPAAAAPAVSTDVWVPSPTDIRPAGPNAYAYDDLSKQVSIEFWSVGWLAQPSPADDPIRLMFEEELNVNLTVSFLTSADFLTKLTLRSAANDPPDLFFNQSGNVARASVQRLVDQGFFMTDYDSVIDKYGPTLKQSISSFARIAASKDGVLQFIPKGPENRDDIWYFVIRQDWLKNLNLSMPRNDEEFLDVLKKFTFNDPNRSGRNDTWGITSDGNKMGLGRALTTTAVLFGNPTEYGIENGEVSHPMVNGVKRKMLEFVKRIVDAGVIDPDWYTQDWGRQKNNLLTGKIGSVVYPVNAIIGETEVANGKEGTTLDWWTWVPLMTGAGYAGPPARERMTWTYPGAYWGISARTGRDDVKLKRVMHFLDNMQYPNRGYYITEGGYGVFPEYKFAGEPGKPWTLEPGSIDPRTTRAGWTALVDWRRNNTVGTLYPGAAGNMVQTYPDEMSRRIAELQQAKQLEANENAKSFYERTDLLLSLDSRAVTNVADIVGRNEILFVTGQRSFGEWDAYVAEWRRAGGDALLKQAEDQYKSLGLVK